ncbi:MAG: apolipoprotein N-acyltransferase [Magnetovibrio sp.]|nr:apolipoprotein N-acyltransferase [Magnetovibrio sp.]
MSLFHMTCDLKCRMQGLSKWRTYSLAGMLGFAAAFAMPPLYQIYLLIPAFSGLLWLVGGAATRWRAFVVGWWFGAGFFAAGLYWVSFALLVDAAKFGWLIPIAMLGLAFGFGLYSGLTAVVVRLAGGLNLAAQALLLASSWTFFEWVRGWFLTGFPWNPLGTIWAFSDPLLQGASGVGVYGLSLLAALLATLPGALVDRGRMGWVLNGLAVVVLGALWLGGQHRLSLASDDVVPGVRLRLVQPNILQASKWDPTLRERHMVDQLRLGTSPPLNGAAKPTHVIWAETSAPFFIATHQPWLDVVGAMTPKGGLTILGAPKMVPADDRNLGPLRVTNSLLAIDDLGHVGAQYDKFHLVPFGEYVPFKDWLPLDRITQGAGSFLPGPGLVTLNLKGLPPVSPLICYEIIFPGAVTDGTGRARWILNLTNDAWFGQTAGPYQHFVNAQMRAVEQGLPVVRVAGTGMSAIFDGYGRVQGKLLLGEKGFLDGDLPKALTELTPYARYGNTVPLGLIFMVAVAGIGVGFSRRTADQRL